MPFTLTVAPSPSGSSGKSSNAGKSDVSSSPEASEPGSEKHWRIESVPFVEIGLSWKSVPLGSPQTKRGRTPRHAHNKNTNTHQSGPERTRSHRIATSKKAVEDAMPF
jgi:hypothetical protein